MLIGTVLVVFPLLSVVWSSHQLQDAMNDRSPSVHDVHQSFHQHHSSKTKHHHNHVVTKESPSISKGQDDINDAPDPDASAREQEVLEWAAKNDRLPIVRILQQARYHLGDTDLFTPELLERLPKWSSIVDAYGPPQMIGLEECRAFREAVPSLTRRKMGVAGFFNSGTNLLHALLLMNCWKASDDVVEEKYGVYWQVVWGKHYFANYRDQHFSTKFSMDERNVTEYMPIVTVRDPCKWCYALSTMIVCKRQRENE